MPSKSISVGQLNVANDRPFVLFGGMNVLESKELAFDIAEHYIRVCSALNIPYVFKASFDKANRSSITSFRGPGLEQGLQWMAELKDKYNVPLITDVHEPYQAEAVAQVADVIQVPAFLSRQTDLVVAMAKTGAVINIKKAQFLAASEMKHIIRKIQESGNDQIMLCERGTSFGYNNLIVDTLGFRTLKSFDYPVIFDVTHALQKPGGLANAAGGRRSQVFDLMRAGLSQSIAGLFLEAHPDPDKALCDGPCALPLDKLEAFLTQAKAVDELIKGFDEVVVD
ncbi:MAG: 3-deoxy-8-phosphooctulonate synthase [Pseudomonadota bacterium]